MEDDIELCVLGTSDYQDVLELWNRSGLTIRAAGRDSAPAFELQMAWGVQRVIGLRKGGTLLAVAVLTHDGRKGWINRLAVDPAYRCQGLAQQLIVAAERWFTEELGLEVWAALIEHENAVSQALFARMGFRRHDLVYVSKRTRAEA